MSYFEWILYNLVLDALEKANLVYSYTSGEIPLYQWNNRMYIYLYIDNKI